MFWFLRLVFFIFLMLSCRHNYAQSFNHVTLCVVDAAKSEKFYVRLFNLKSLNNPYNDSETKWLVLSKGEALHLVGNAGVKIEHAITTHIAFAVPDINEFIGKLHSLNVPYYNDSQEKSKITLRPDNVHQIYFQDPDDYWIEVNDEK